MAIDLKKFILRFVEEARDHLNLLNDGLSAMEAGETEIIHTLFRSAHTIKGSSRMLKLLTISETAHKLEDVMGALRDGTITFAPALGDLLHQTVDGLATLVDLLATTPDNTILPPLDETLCTALTQAASGVQTTIPTPPLPPPPMQTEPPPVDTKLKIAETVRVRLEKLDELIKLMGELISSHGGMRQRLIEINALAAHDTQESSHLPHFTKQFKEDVLAQELLMNELHDKTLKLRMLPLAIVFEPVGRLIRELARSIGKQVECHIHGTEIELDRLMIDKLSDPIIHLIRNAIDHGLESPEKRLAQNKPAPGRLTLSARQDGRWVIIDINDDGNGIPLAHVRDQAVKKGFVSEKTAHLLTEKEIIDFLFLPGFSTKSRVNDMSGRGVGLDVVRQCILNDLQGTITVQTQAGTGTTFSLRLPLSLAMMRLLLVETQGIPFGIPAPYVAELLRLPNTAQMMVAERNIVVIHNEFVPIVLLSELLRIPVHLTKPNTKPNENNGLLVVVLKINNEKMAIQVDGLLDERDMVINPLPKPINAHSTVSGMVITGHNALVSVLHAPALIQLARRYRSREQQNLTNKQLDKILVVDDSLNTREIEKDVLEAHGYQVTLAEDGLDGLHKALESSFNAIITDVEMPGMDGFALTARLRKEAKYRDTPIIIISSREKTEDKRRGMHAGADAYIVKGDFNQSNLVETLRSLLG